LRIKDGTVLWNTNLGDKISYTALDKKSDLFVITNSKSKTEGKNELPVSNEEERLQFLHSINTLTGLTNWRIKLEKSPSVRLYVIKDFIIVIFSNGFVKSFSTINGELRWQFRKNFPINSAQVSEKFIILETESNILFMSVEDGA